MAGRCVPIPITSQGLREPMAERLQLIAQMEDLDGKPLASYVQLMKDCKNNIRAAIQAIKSGRMLT